MASDTRAPAKREKVVLKKGFHLMDWMRLVQSSFDLSGRKGGAPLQVTSKELRLHNKETDCWTVYNGKVYNLTPYMPYHPGGPTILMEGAGKDSTRLFNKYHAWVNCESIIGKCYVGVFVGNGKGRPAEEENEEEASKPVPEKEDEAEAEAPVAVESVFTGVVGAAAVATSTGGADASVSAAGEALSELSVDSRSTGTATNAEASGKVIEEGGSQCRSS